MIRRSFRIGLTLGLLGGLAFALAKVLGARSQPVALVSPAPEPWPRLTREPAAATSVAPRAAPPAGAPANPTTDTAQASEPEVPAPVPSPPPLPDAPARPRAKKAPLKAAPVASSSMAPAPGAKAPRAKKAPLKAAPAKRSAPRAQSATSWVAPSGDVCPTTHPVKAKLASKIFHLPGMLNYDRTRPDRCYRDAAAAEDDGLRPAKR